MCNNLIGRTGDETHYSLIVKNLHDNKHITILVVLFPSTTFSQNPEWMNFGSGAFNVSAIADEGDYLWFGGGGLTRFNKNTGEMIFYNKANSELPTNWVTSVAVDLKGNKWIGTSGDGLAKFDGESWTVYNSSIVFKKMFLA